LSTVVVVVVVVVAVVDVGSNLRKLLRSSKQEIKTQFSISSTEKAVI
jgi:hypothetical protein